MKADSKKSLWLYLIPILPFLLIGIYVFSYPVLPMQEFPDWLYQGWIWNQYVFFHNGFGGYFILNPYISPNSTFTILIGLLNLIASPTNAGKIAVLLCCFTLYSGIYLFVRMHLIKNQVTVVLSTIAATSIAFLFVFNFNLFLGQLHFLLGLGIALCSAYLFHEKGWHSKILPMMLLFILCYCTHFMAFAQLVVYCFLVIVIERRRESLKPMILALVPIGIVFIHYFMTSHITGVEGSVSFGMMLKEKIMVFPRIIAPFVRFKAIIGSAETPIKILNFAITTVWITAIVVVLTTHIRKKQVFVLDWIVIITFLIAISLPPISLGMFAPGERFVMLGAISGILLFFVEFPRFRKLTVTTLVLLSFSNYLWSHYQTIKFEQRISTGEIISIADKSGLIDPSLRLIYYKTIQERKTIPIFTTGLFSFSESIKPDIYFNTGQMKVSIEDTTSNKNYYDPYR